MRSILYEEGFPLAIRETYLAQILGLVGSRQYQKLFVLHPDQSIEDVIRNGDLACAYVVSSVLTLCELTKGGVHTTVDEVVRDLERSGWMVTEHPVPGAVIVWGARLCTDGVMHRHIGFSIGDCWAVSNDPRTRVPKIHNHDFGGARAVEKIYYHPVLRED